MNRESQAQECPGSSMGFQLHACPQHWGALGGGIFPHGSLHNRFPAANPFLSSSRLRPACGLLPLALPAAFALSLPEVSALVWPMPWALPALSHRLQKLPVEIPPLPLSWQRLGVSLLQRLQLRVPVLLQQQQVGLSSSLAKRHFPSLPRGIFHLSPLIFFPLAPGAPGGIPCCRSQETAVAGTREG